MNTTENTRERPDTSTEYWRLGGCLDRGEESIIITSEQIRHENQFLSPEHLGSEETLTPVLSPKKYKNWLKRMDGLDGYCYLKMYKRKYRPYAHLLYRRYPKLGKLNLQMKYLSEAFDELNICINYITELFHIYQTSNVIYQHGYEKVVGNHRIIGDEWHKEFHVGATQTQTESSRTQQQQQQQPQGNAFNMRQMLEVPDD